MLPLYSFNYIKMEYYKTPIVETLLITPLLLLVMILLVKNNSVILKTLGVQLGETKDILKS
jgi:hypothetical protein